MTSVLAVSRPTEWNFPLFVHVFGAMILVGGLLAGASIITYARGDVRSLRLGYWTLLAVAFPGYIVMRIGAQWIYSKEGLEDLPEDPTWIGIGFMVADIGALLVLIALILGGIGVRRLRSGGGTGLLKATMVIAWIVLAAALVAVWAMSGKPD
jgi:ABC-type maltose transport system permease subunit